MYKYSNSSKDKLKTCHPLLQLLFKTVIKYFDNTIAFGYRSEKEQNAAYASGKSKVKFPDSKHNEYPSMAVDSYPYVGGAVSYEAKQCYFYAAFVLGVASMLNIKVRSGADWDSDKDINDQKFNDICHFELIEEVL